MPVWLDRSLLVLGAIGVIAAMLLAWALDWPAKAGDVISEVWEKLWSRFGALAIALFCAALITVGYMIYSTGIPSYFVRKWLKRSVSRSRGESLVEDEGAKNEEDRPTHAL